MVTSNKKADKPCPLWTRKQKSGRLVRVLKIPGESPFCGLQTAAFLLSSHRDQETPTILSKVEKLMLGDRSVEQLQINT